MEPLRVVALLTNAYVTNDPWSPALDAILAYWQLREQLGEEEFALGMTGARPLVEPELPLARESDAEGRWWWVCSSPIVNEPRHAEWWFHRRFDAGAALAFVDPRVKKVLVKGGAYKTYRNRRLLTLPGDRQIVWHCVGEADEIRRLLRRCANVGAGHARGQGAVRDWLVTPDGADERLARVHRPLPLDHALALGAVGTVLDWGLRPPGRAPEHRARCVLP